MASVARRLVLTGAESTGKTTLAKALAAHFRIPWVPEFARDYTAAHAGPLSSADVEPIARGQLELEATHAAASRGSSLILDTDLLSTWVYARFYYGSCPVWIDEYLRVAPGDLYLLCDLDLAWVDDPVRDQAAARDEIQARFLAELTERRLPFRQIRGTGQQRLGEAVKVVQAHFGW